ncbi:recombinase family protein [Caulobacter sp. 602-1]|uniref:recombinase family protein n=1 Tax=Caulobacter sp. 602-1 TaxID=2492472 RepID=UPI000F63A6D9|nr:recombinase family protein [Caulobacter sp. 602-1]RRN64680.1 recombinase family protein [Caulobacter sp. 602-1]
MGRLIAPEPTSMASRAALYLRVSTGRQAESDLSIPDQRRQMQAYCAGKGWTTGEEFVEPGNTATDDKRPAFQAMMDAALTKPAPFDVIIVHSFSRFFRDQFQFEFYFRKMAKNGVRLVSITQELGDDPMSEMMRKIMALFDEYQSRENAKHTLRAMKENARQGFWNGSRPPLGYRVYVAEQRGPKLKKKLEIDPVNAEKIRLIYRLALVGADGYGPMGFKAIAAYLNDREIRTRDGGKFGLDAIHQILHRPSYMGEHHFNRTSAKLKKRKPESEHAICEVPAIVTREEFQAVQDSLHLRHWKQMRPNHVNCGLLLAGICFCAKCGGAMTLRTGCSSTGLRYRYYTCSTKARQGPTGCEGITVRVDKLEAAVVDHLERRLLHPERLEVLLGNVIDKRTDWIDRRRSHVVELRQRATQAASKLKRLYEAVEDGLASTDDQDLKDRMRELAIIRDESRADADRAEAAIEKLGPMLTPEVLARFAEATKERLRDEHGKYRREHVRAVAQRVEVISPSEMRIMGNRTDLLRTMAASAGEQSAVLGVRILKPKWRTRHDSNV